MRTRRKSEEKDDANRERWLVSYADFITLLFAFFVVMYAISSVNEGKYRVLSDSLNAVFADPSHLDRRLPALASPPPKSLADRIHLPDPVPLPAPTPASPNDAPHALDTLQSQLDITLEPYRNDGLVEIARVGDQLQIQIKSKLLFESGSSDLSRDALAALRDLARILVPVPNPVKVEGHTDDVPISTNQFPSNWELSAARAASVVHFFSRLGVAAERLSAVGFGEFRPIASNATEDGKARNRRVSVMVMPVDEVPWAEGPAMPEPSSLPPDEQNARAASRTQAAR